jgi:hypothetical protein
VSAFYPGLDEKIFLILCTGVGIRKASRLGCSFSSNSRFCSRSSILSASCFSLSFRSFSCSSLFPLPSPLTLALSPLRPPTSRYSLRPTSTRPIPTNLYLLCPPIHPNPLWRTALHRVELCVPHTNRSDPLARVVVVYYRHPAHHRARVVLE